MILKKSENQMALSFSKHNAAGYFNFSSASLLLLLLLNFGFGVHEYASAASSQCSSSVEFLPGFHGPLPFQLETGYVGVDEGEKVQVFYYFAKSESNPKVDPLILWLTGGPGCSSLSGLIYEIGPIMFKVVDQDYINGSLPTLVSNPNSWTKMASIIFVDLPAGTGFSYTKNAPDSHSTDLQFFNHTCEFLRKWLTNHPEFFSNPFYIGGDSYSGIPIPILAQLISNENEAGIEHFINLQGYILGNPMAFPGEGNYKVPFAHGMGLIPDELYESLKRSCGGEYREQYIDPNNFQCLKHLEDFHKCISELEAAHILEPNCGYVSPRPRLFGKRRSLDERFNELYSAKLLPSAFYCRIDGYRLSYYWADDKSVRDALHIRKGSIGKWKRCNQRSLSTVSILDSRQYHLSLSKKGYRSLIYSGDHDMIVPHQSTQAWIKDLNYSIVDQWRPWKVYGQIAGYTRTYSNKMTFATVKGGGHTAPEYRPEECYAMFERWISHEPL